MTYKEIDNFIKKYGGKNIHFYIDNKKNSSSAAVTYYFGKKENNKIYLIVLNKHVFCNKKLPKAYKQAMILHEIGHVKKNHFVKKISKSVAEFEAQIWALTKSFNYNLKLVKCYLIEIFLSWKNLLKYKRKRYYYKAYKKFYKIIGKKDIKKWENIIRKLSIGKI